MNIWDENKLLLFIGFVIPGFIAIKVYDLINPSSTRESSKHLIDAVAYSSINYACLVWPIIYIEATKIPNQHPFLYRLFYFFVLFVFPVFMAWGWSQLRKTEYFQRNAPHPTLRPWDFVFSQRKYYWVKVTLKDGTKLAGPYAERSFASSSPAEEQIYLEESWIINSDGGFERPKERSDGVIIMASEISYVELTQYGDEDE